MPKDIPEEFRVYIRDAALQLNRRIGTLRKWEAEGVLPARLMPRRGKRNWRYWSEQQVEEIAEWIRKTDRRPGKALEGLQTPPSDAEVEAHIASMRRPHRPSFAPESEPAKPTIEQKYGLSKPISPDPLRARLQVRYEEMDPVAKRTFTREYNSHFKKSAKSS